MARHFLDLAFTPAVLGAQQQYFGRSQQRSPAPSPTEDVLGPDETAFIEARDSFYMASVSETGWPYLQHRGGPAGFCRVVGPNQLAFADYRGNRQLLSTGNLASDDRVCLFLMDYPHRERLKLLGHATVLDARDHPDLVARLATPDLARITERIFSIHVEAFDWNCPQYIHPRYTAEEVETLIATPLKARIAELEARLKTQDDLPSNPAPSRP